MKEILISIMAALGMDSSRISASTDSKIGLTTEELTEIQNKVNDLTAIREQLATATTAKSTAEATLATVQGELTTAKADAQAKADALTTANTRITELEAKVAELGRKPGAEHVKPGGEVVDSTAQGLKLGAHATSSYYDEVAALINR